jgi:hypothetical protein
VSLPRVASHRNLISPWPFASRTQDEMLAHFMEYGYCVVKQAFTREQAQEMSGDVWVRLGMDPNDQSTWTKVSLARGRGTSVRRSTC